MILTYGNTKDDLAPFVNSGSNPNSSITLGKVNRAIMNLMLLDDWKLTLQKMRFKITQDHIVLPQFVQSIITFRMLCGGRGNVFSPFYEFMEAGPGQADFNGNPGIDLEDLGDSWSTFHEIPVEKPLKLIALSSDIKDTSSTIHIRGEVAGREITTDGAMGIDLQIMRWQQGVEGMINKDAMVTSAETFREITHVIKPVTQGFITLLGIDPDTSEMFVLAVYHPFDTVPGYRRYKVINHDCTNGDSLIAMCRMRYMPLRHDNDPLIIQNLPAIIAMLQAMNAQESGDVKSAENFEQVAIRWLARQGKQNDESRNMLDFQIRDWGSGDIPTMR